MAGQTIGTVNVQIGQSPNPRTTTIQYGGRTLKSATDLQFANAKNGDVIVYQANTNTFVVESIGAITPSLDSGFF